MAVAKPGGVETLPWWPGAGAVVESPCTSPTGAVIVGGSKLEGEEEKTKTKNTTNKKGVPVPGNGGVSGGPVCRAYTGDASVHET